MGLQNSNRLGIKQTFSETHHGITRLGACQPHNELGLWAVNIKNKIVTLSQGM